LPASLDSAGGRFAIGGVLGTTSWTPKNEESEGAGLQEPVEEASNKIYDVD
jgi:hypothetical protein